LALRNHYGTSVMHAETVPRQVLMFTSQINNLYWTSKCFKFIIEQV